MTFREIRLKSLKALYDLHQDITGDWDPACGPGCAVCCTDQVTITTLEARYLLECHPGTSPGPKAINPHKPQSTINELAYLCLNCQEPPQEPDRAARPCPLLDENQCPVYEARPLACRALFSKNTCQPGGWADMPPLWLTVNQVFCQFVEHLDVPGMTGNMHGVLAWLLAGESADEHGLLKNRPVPGLIVPDEHRNTLAPIVRELSRIMP